MRNDIRRLALKNLANAPKIVAKKTINDLTSPNDKEEAKRLFSALGIRIKDGDENEE